MTWGWLLAGLLMVRSALAQPLDLETAAKRVQEQVQGRVLGGKMVTEGERTVHVIRVLTPEGRVRHIRVDAQTGEIFQAPPAARQ